MSIIKKISLTQFKNYDFAEFDLSAPVVCITGLNGVGKTNLLDAIYYLCYTKSYFTGYQQQLAKHNTDGFRLEGVFEKDSQLENVSCKWRSGKKEVIVGGTEVEKITDYIGRHTAVMIAPDDIALINESGEERRKWMDSTLAQTDKHYLNCLLQYQHILQLRNAWLKMYAVRPVADFTQLDYYDEKLAENGSYIFERRKLFVEEVKENLSVFYNKMSGGKECVGMEYKSELFQKNFLKLLKDTIQYDIRLQRTTKGIHRDNVDLLSEGKLMRQFGSQGQKKSLLFALKLTQYRYLQLKTGGNPLLLLDDIFEKLDEQRLNALLKIVMNEGFPQVLMTDTHENRILSPFDIQKAEKKIILK